MTDLVIDVHDLHKNFGARRVVDGLTLQVGQGRQRRAQLVVLPYWVYWVYWDSLGIRRGSLEPARAWWPRRLG